MEVGLEPAVVCCISDRRACSRRGRCGRPVADLQRRLGRRRAQDAAEQDEDRKCRGRSTRARAWAGGSSVVGVGCMMVDLESRYLELLLTKEGFHDPGGGTTPPPFHPRARVPEERSSRMCLITLDAPPRRQGPYPATRVLLPRPDACLTFAGILHLSDASPSEFGLHISQQSSIFRTASRAIRTIYLVPKRIFEYHRRNDGTPGETKLSEWRHTARDGNDKIRRLNASPHLLAGTFRSPRAPGRTLRAARRPALRSAGSSPMVVIGRSMLVHDLDRVDAVRPLCCARRGGERSSPRAHCTRNTLKS